MHFYYLFFLDSASASDAFILRSADHSESSCAGQDSTSDTEQCSMSANSKMNLRSEDRRNLFPLDFPSQMTYLISAWHQ